jgi:hypothetical protein
MQTIGDRGERIVGAVMMCEPVEALVADDRRWVRSSARFDDKREDLLIR